MFFLLPLLTQASFLCPDPTQHAVPVDLEKYTGTWYEIARSAIIRGTFEKNCKCVTATYTLVNNTLQVENLCVNSKSNAANTILGYAKPLDQELGILSVSFPSVKYQASRDSPNYVITKLWEDEDGEYEQVFVGGSCKAYAWVLSRTPSISDDRYNEILQYAKSVGYRLGFLWMKKTDQECNL